MANKKIIIIGAGISGLCAGSYLQMNGYDTEIFELHDKPGGLCTAWKRKGYVFNGCIHWLVGSLPGDQFYGLWNELIDMESIRFVEPEKQFQYVSKDGATLNLYVDPVRLRDELFKLAPKDGAFIDQIVKAITKFRNLDITIDNPMELMSISNKISALFKMLPYLKSFIKYANISITEMGEKCRNPFLKEVFTCRRLFNNFAFFALIMSLAWASKKSSGYPIGGSLYFAKMFEKTYRDLGGTIHYGSKVTAITEANDMANGIELENGQKHDSDIVISAADGHYTIYEMLKGKYIDAEIEDLYKGRNKSLVPYPSLVYVCLGISKDLKDIPPHVIYGLDEPIVVDNKTETSHLDASIYNFDPTLAPEGKCSLVVMIESYAYDYWVELRKKDRERYDAEKQAIAEKVIDVLDDKIGHIKENVEVIDVATPATFGRYTNNWKGSYEGWLPGPGALLKTIKKELPGLANFYTIGQWVQPGGGLPPAILSGRSVTQIICKRDGKQFTAAKPGDCAASTSRG